MDYSNNWVFNKTEWGERFIFIRILYEFHKSRVRFLFVFLLILIFFNYKKKEIFKQYSNTALN